MSAISQSPLTSSSSQSQANVAGRLTRQQKLTAAANAIASAHKVDSLQPPQLQAYSEKKKAKQADLKKRGQALAKSSKARLDKMRKEGVKPAKRQTKATKAGLLFPATRVHKRLQKTTPGRRIYATSGVMLTGVLEYLTAEVLELAGNVSAERKRQRITPRDLYLAVQNDPELDALLSHVIIQGGGVMPHVHPSLATRTRTEYYKDKMAKVSAHTVVKASQVPETPTDAPAAAAAVEQAAPVTVENVAASTTSKAAKKRKPQGQWVLEDSDAKRARSD